MPIEVNELVIKAVVQDQNAAKGERKDQQSDEQKEEWIKEAVEQILRILSAKKDR